MSSSIWKAAVCSGSLFLGGLAFRLLNNGSLFGIKKKNDIPINEVLLYGSNDEGQTKQIGLNNLFCIYYVIVHANCSIDVCVPNLESETILKCLIGAQQKKVKVRLVVHNDSEFDFEKLTKHGVLVKIIKPLQPLQHEFILVDAADEAGEAVAVMGSLDYETTRVNCNRDATVLTSEALVVKSLKREFDRVWDSTDGLFYSNCSKI